MRYIWIYKIPNIGHFIAKQTPWSCYSSDVGGTQYTIAQGVMIEEPAWESVTKIADQTFATFHTYMYNVTDLGALNFRGTQ